MSQTSIDDRERAAFARALGELGYDAADFEVHISALPPIKQGPLGGALSRSGVIERQEVVATRISSRETFRVEVFAGESWAGEVMQAVIAGLLGSPAAAPAQRAGPTEP